MRLAYIILLITVVSALLIFSVLFITTTLHLNDTDISNISSITKNRIIDRISKTTESINSIVSLNNSYYNLRYTDNYNFVSPTAQPSTTLLNNIVISDKTNQLPLIDKSFNNRLDIDDDITIEDDIEKHLLFNKNLPSSRNENIIKQISNHTSSYQTNSVCKTEEVKHRCPVYYYVRFWKYQFTKPQDCYSSPLRHPLGLKADPSELKYLVFMPDEGGWNNIRMAAETAIVFGLITGRVIVLPPEKKLYLLDKNDHPEDNISTFDKFFDLDHIREIADVITMKEFINNIALKGLLNIPVPSGYTADTFAVTGGRLWKYLEKACYTREWQPGRYFIGFNFTKTSKSTSSLGYDSVDNVLDDGTGRIKLFASHDRKVISYNDTFHSQRAVFFPGDYRETHRLLTHFYSYLYFAQPDLERLYKRLVRDRLHYHDDIFCVAGQIVKLLHERSVKVNYGQQMPINSHKLTGGGDTNFGATYFAYHIRRGDFQYGETQISAETILENTIHLLDPLRSKLIYIATDEKNRSFFKPFENSGFRIVYLSDYIHKVVVPDGHDHLNRNHIGMIEQVICANAHTFIGTPLSTFTGYITRMRGYYRDNRYSRTFYTMKSQMYQLRDRPELVGPFWAREFAVAHKNVDDDPKLNY